MVAALLATRTVTGEVIRVDSGQTPRRARPVSAHRVTASIDFSYGHRLLGHRGRCRRLHGHNGRLEVEVAAGALDDLGMVVDFADIKRSVGAWVDETPRPQDGPVRARPAGGGA